MYILTFKYVIPYCYLLSLCFTLDSPELIHHITGGLYPSLLLQLISLGYVVVQLLSRVQLFATTWPAARQASLSFTISRSLLKLISIELMMLSNHLFLCHPLLLLPSIFSSILRFLFRSYKSFLVIFIFKYLEAMFDYSH